MAIVTAIDYIGIAILVEAFDQRGCVGELKGHRGRQDRICIYDGRWRRSSAVVVAIAVSRRSSFWAASIPDWIVAHHVVRMKNPLRR